eukprot:12321302-Alexandrium_andersonii.AAC.1
MTVACPRPSLRRSRSGRYCPWSAARLASNSRRWVAAAGGSAPPAETPTTSSCSRLSRGRSVGAARTWTP